MEISVTCHNSSEEANCCKIEASNCCSLNEIELPPQKIDLPNTISFKVFEHDLTDNHPFKAKQRFSNLSTTSYLNLLNFHPPPFKKHIIFQTFIC